MKKLLTVFVFLFTVFILAGCSNFLNLTTSEFEPTTEQVTIDYEQLYDDVYQRVYQKIYSDLFNDLKNQVIDDISEEEVLRIYQDIRLEIESKVISGELELHALTAFDQLVLLGQTSAKSVIGIRNINTSGELASTGSGVIYKKDGNQYYVITNEHVVNGASRIEIQFEDETIIQAELLGVENLVDLAVLKFVSEESYQTSSFGDSDLVRKGGFISAVGNPSGFDYFNTMTFGIVSGVNRYFDIDNDGTRDMFVNYIQHDAAINSGNSGGALFNMYGEIIGINTLKIVDYSIEGMGFAIPSNLVELIAGDIEEFGFSRRKPMLGITFIDIFQNKAVLNQEEQLIPDDINHGFYIQSVVSGSTVDGYILPGDIVVQIGNIVIQNTNHFVEQFTQYIVGDIIDIVVYRDGQYLTLSNIELKGRS